MTKINEVTAGSIVIERRKYHRDVIIFVEGTVKKRGGGFRMFGSHEIKERELEELSQGQPEVIIVGNGTDGTARIAAQAESWAKADDVSLLVQPSYDVIVKVNGLTEQKKKVAGLIQITC